MSTFVDDQPRAVDIRQLKKSLARTRSLLSFFLSGLTTLFTLVALVPLFSIITMLVTRGLAEFRWSMFVELPPQLTDTGGGFGNALLGTLLMVGIASLLSVPLGILAAVYLSELGPESRLSQGVRFAARILTGFPSILAGVFAYTTVVILTGRPSAVAGGFALSILMLPTVIIAAEEALRSVPKPMKEAALALGATRSQAITRVMLPTAFPGLFTGVMLAVARAIGETAPLLYTAQFSFYWFFTGGVDLMQPTSSLSILIYKFFVEEPTANREAVGWSAALVLVLLVLGLNLIGQFFARRRS